MTEELARLRAENKILRDMAASMDAQIHGEWGTGPDPGWEENWLFDKLVGLELAGEYETTWTCPGCGYEHHESRLHDPIGDHAAKRRARKDCWKCFRLPNTMVPMPSLSDVPTESARVELSGVVFIRDCP
jgi:hypothetical protein